MNDMTGADGSEQQPFAERGEDDDLFIRQMIQQRLSAFGSTDECTMFKAILEDAFLSKDLATVDVGSSLQICFEMAGGSKSSAMQPPIWRFPPGRQYLIEQKTLLRRKYHFLLAILDHVICCVQDQSSVADWGDVAGTAIPETDVRIILRRRASASTFQTTQWTLTTRQG